jgi:uncharacterized delta-60 repeat protein
MATDLDLTFNTPNGFLKTTFNTLLVPPETLPQDVGVSVVIRSDNRIVMGGYSQYSSGTYISLSCYNTDGSLYTAFGVGGKVLASPTFSNFSVNDVILQPNDYIIVTGTNSSSSPSIFAARFTSLGALDTSFGTSGYVIIVPGAFGSQFDECYSNSVILQSNNYIVLGGYVRRITPGPNKNFIALVRLDTTGTPDTSFGTSSNGTVYAAFNSSTNNEDICNCLSIQTDGKIVSGGVNSLISGLSQNLSVSRFTTGGSLDTTFNSLGPTPGWLIIPNLSSYNFNFSSGLGINSVGQIIISSYITKTSSEQCFGVAAVTSSGTLDTSFGTGGQSLLDLSPTYNLISPSFTNGANALALQSDNKIVITCGFLNTATAAEGFSLARFDTNGALDLTFGLAGLGYILSDLDSPNTEVGYSVAIQTDGKVIIGGTEINFGDESGSKNFILSRYFGFPPFPPPIPPIPTPVVPICFPAGTPVLTDQGYIAIEEINPEINTINNKPIIAITKTITNDDKIVCFEKNSLGKNMPSQRTYISVNHGILYNKRFMQAKEFIGKIRGVYYKEYNGEYLYNVLMEKHYWMTVNDIKVETLNPNNIIAKLYKTNSQEEKLKIILKINEYSSNYYNKNYKKHNNYKVYGRLPFNVTRRNYQVHRYNPIVKNINFYTKKNMFNNVNRFRFNNNYLNHRNNTSKIYSQLDTIKKNPIYKINTIHKFTRNARLRR